MGSIRLRSTRALLLAGLLLASCATAVGDAPAPDKLVLVGLLKEGQFATLEATLDEYQQRFEADPEAQSPAIEAFEAFKNSDPAIDPRLDEWIAAMPQSYAAPLARGVFQGHLGWLCRASSADDSDLSEQGMQAVDGHFALARRDLERALALNPRLVLAYETLADMALAEDDTAATKRILDAGLAEVPEALALHFEYLYALAPDEIHEHLAMLRQRYPEVAAHGFFRGYEDYRDGEDLVAREKYADALAAFDRALAVGPRVPAFLVARAETLYALGRDDEAIATLRHVLEIRPQAANYYAELAKYLALSGQGHEAIASMDQAIAFDRLNPCYLWRRAGLFEWQGRFTEAAADLDAALTYGSFDPGILLFRSRVLMRFPYRLDDAVAGAKRAIELQSWNSLGWLRLAEALYFKQDCKAQEALRVFRERCQSDGRCAAEQTDSSIGSGFAYMQCPKV